jgi:hypothetical protein
LAKAGAFALGAHALGAFGRARADLANDPNVLIPEIGQAAVQKKAASFSRSFLNFGGMLPLGDMLEGTILPDLFGGRKMAQSEARNQLLANAGQALDQLNEINRQPGELDQLNGANAGIWDGRQPDPMKIVIDRLMAAAKAQYSAANRLLDASN